MQPDLELFSVVCLSVCRCPCLSAVLEGNYCLAEVSEGHNLKALASQRFVHWMRLGRERLAEDNSVQLSHLW